jgi:SsrA-binding protein
MKIFNKRAGFEYQLTDEKFEAGLELLGMEARAFREGHGDISQSHIRILDSEAYLINADIPVKGARNYNSTRIRKLLLHKRQIVSLITKVKQEKFAIVPTKLYNKGRLVKVEIVLGRPKREFQKKETIKKRDIEREISQEMKSKGTI